MRRVVARQFGGTQERNVATQRPPRLGNRRIVGGENQPIQRARCLRRLDRVGDERLTAQQLQVLAGESLRTATGRHDAKDSHAVCASIDHRATGTKDDVASDRRRSSATGRRRVPACRLFRRDRPNSISESFAIARFARRPTISSSCPAGMPVPGRLAQTSPTPMSRRPRCRGPTRCCGEPCPGRPALRAESVLSRPAPSRSRARHAPDPRAPPVPSSLADPGPAAIATR